MDLRRIFKLTVVGVVILFLASSSTAFVGEAAVVKVLLDFLLRMNLSQVGEDLLLYIMDICRAHFVEILLLNPDPMNPSILGITRYIITLLEPIFVSVIILCGLYIIFFSGSPRVRVKVKSILPGVIIAMVLITLSPYIMAVVFQFSRILSLGIMSQGPADPMNVLLPLDEDINPMSYFMSKFQNIAWYSTEASILFLYLSVLLLFALLIMVFIRYITVALFAVILPLTILLYLFIPTRGIGKRMMEQTLLWIFVQVTEAIALISVVTIIMASSPFLVKEALVLLELGGILALIFIPIATISVLRDFLPG